MTPKALTLREWVELFRDREKTEMPHLIAAETLGVSRQTLAGWLQGAWQPLARDRENLSRRTGYLVPADTFTREGMKR